MDTTVLGKYPRLKQVADLSPKYRPNEQGTVDHAALEVGKELSAWFQDNFETQQTYEFGHWKADLMQQIRSSPGHKRSRSGGERLNEAWRHQAKRAKNNGIAFATEDKIDGITIICAMLAQGLTDMAMATERYEPTSLSRDEVARYHEEQTHIHLGTPLRYEPQPPIYMPSTKSHKNPPGIRNVTNYARKGPHTAYRYAQQLLSAVRQVESQHPLFTCTKSTTDMLRQLPANLNRIIDRDAVGFFDKLNQQQACNIIDGMIDAMFSNKGTEWYLKVTQRSYRWQKTTGYVPTNNTHFTATKTKWLIRHLVTNDYTLYRGKLQKARTGTPMGAPMSSLFADLSVWGVEKATLPVTASIMTDNLNETIHYKRYADDTGSNIPEDIFQLTMAPPMATLGVTFVKDNDLPHPQKCNLLDTTITIADDGTTSTSTYSKRRTLQPEGPIAPIPGGANTDSMIKATRAQFIRRAIQNNSTIQAFVNEITQFARHPKHAHISCRTLAKTVHRELQAPTKDRYNLRNADRDHISYIIRTCRIYHT